MPDIDHAGFHRGVGKFRESNMCHFPASTILLLTLCQWFKMLYNTQKAIQENQDATIDAFAVICGPIIPTGRLWLLQGYHAGTHWCSEKCRVSMVPAPNICLYNTYSLVYKLHLKHECQYNTYLIRVMPRVIAISGPIKPTGGGSCRISHWFPSVHRKTGPTGRVWPVPDSMPVPIGRVWLVPDSMLAPIAPPDNPGY